MKHLFSIAVLLIIVWSAAVSQELIVKSFELDSRDMSAQLSERKDLNGMPCSLVKVHLAKSGAVFHGNIVGETSYEMSEYLVYMAQGSKWIDVRLTDYLPLKVYFPDYGVSQLEAKQTYVLTIILPNYASLPVDDGMSYFLLSVEPHNALVFLDGDLKSLDEDGSLMLRLARGNHSYRVVASGYETKEENFVLGMERMSRNVKLKPSTSSTSTPSSSSPARQIFTVNGVSFAMMRVEGGTFTMGATSEQGSDAYASEKPAHQVTLSSYSISVTEVTQELWEAVMGSNPSKFKGAKRPVECVSWDDCQEFIRKLNAKTGKTFRLPTEAEWEYAARGGNKSRGFRYAGSNSLDGVAWYSNNSGNMTHNVATKQSNELGLYDMSGNVWEWCSDWYGNYSSSSQTNPNGPSSGSYRVCRGGSWCYDANNCRLSFRSDCGSVERHDYLGLRLVLSE